MTPRKRYRCRFCGVSFAALPVTQEPNGAVLLNHLAARHRDRVGPYLRRMEAGEDIAETAAEGKEPSPLVEELLWQALNDRRTSAP
jgi:hypothetical protein